MSEVITDVIFDLDGTLIDSASSILRCFSATLSKQGVEPALPLTEKLIGPPLRETLVKLSGVQDEAVLELMIEDFKSHYDTEGYKATTVFTGVEEMLREVHSMDVKLHIATNKRLNPTRLILDYLGWDSMFSSIYASDSQNPSFTSKSEMLSSLINNEGILRSQAVYIGDRADDMKAATKNMLGFIAAIWGYQDEGFSAGEGGLIIAEHPSEINRKIVMMNDL